jgi:hypothetical protein
VQMNRWLRSVTAYVVTDGSSVDNLCGHRWRFC